MNGTMAKRHSVRWSPGDSPRGSSWAGGRALALGLLGLGACAGSRVPSTERLLEDAWGWTGRGAELDASVAARPPRAAADEPASALPDGEPELWTLDALLERVALANPTLGAARSRLEAAEAVRAEAVAAYFPELSLGVDFVSTDEPGQAFALLLNQERLTLGPGFDPTPGPTENWRKEVRLDWPLFAPGRRSSRLAAEEGEEAARLASEALERRLLNAAVQAWLGLRAARELEEVAAESIAVVERRLEETRRRRDAGAALHADVLRLEVRLAAARQEAAAATLVTRRAESGLNHLLGRAAEAPLPLAGEEARVGALLPDELPLLLARAAEERRDLRASAARIRLAGFEVQATRAARLPSLQGFAAYHVDGDDPSIDTDLDSYLVGVGLHLPLSARTGPRVRRTEARERELREDLRELVLSVEQEVRDASEGLRVAEETLELAEAAVGAAEEAFRIVAAAQDAGGATVTDVLEAEDARRSAQVRHVAARAGVQIARARLVAATGGVR